MGKRSTACGGTCCGATIHIRASITILRLRRRLNQPASCHLGREVGAVIDAAARSDIVEMRLQKAAGAALAELVQPLEELEIVVEPAVWVEGLAGVGHHDAVQPDAAAVA